MASYPLIGKKTIYIDDMIIPPDYIQDEVGTITLTPSTTEIASQSGTIKVPNGSYDELSFELNIICPSVRFLGMLFPELYHNATFKRVISGNISETGQVRFGGNECISNTPRDIIIHNVCDGASSAQDFQNPFPEHPSENPLHNPIQRTLNTPPRIFSLATPPKQTQIETLKKFF